MISFELTDTTVRAAAVVGGLVWLAVVSGLYLWYAWALSRVFPKLDAASWRGWVPVVNEAELFALGGFARWNVVFYVVPVLNLYALYLRIVSIHRINGRFAKSAGATVVGLLLPPIWATMLTRARVQTPVPLVDRIAGAAPPAAAAPAPPSVAATPAVPAAPIVTEPTPTPDPPITSGAPYAIQRHASADVARAAALPPVPASAATPQLAPMPAAPPASRTPPASPWSPTQSEPVAVSPAAMVPVEITAPPLAPARDFKLPPDALSALAASMISRDDDEDPDSPEDGETVVVDRRPRIRWILTVDRAGDLQLKADRVLLGRKPSSATPGTQALSIPDSTRTLSKLHARLDLVDGSWTITDLNSTNGVLLVDRDGAETLMDPGASAEVTGRFILGKVGMSIRFEGDAP